jgi:hypothetical protein
MHTLLGIKRARGDFIKKTGPYASIHCSCWCAPPAQTACNHSVKGSPSGGKGGNGFFFLAKKIAYVEYVRATTAIANVKSAWEFKFQGVSSRKLVLLVVLVPVVVGFIF